MRTEEEARTKVCPLTYSQPRGPFNCVGSGCMLWVERTQSKHMRASEDPPPGYARGKNDQLSAMGGYYVSRVVGRCGLSNGDD